MEPAITGQQTMGHDERSVHNWRVSQLTHLGIPGTLAEIYADRWCGAAAPRGSPCASSCDAHRGDPAR